LTAFGVGATRFARRSITRDAGLIELGRVQEHSERGADFIVGGAMGSRCRRGIAAVAVGAAAFSVVGSPLAHAVT
jgi:hypothetical protein